MVGGISGDQGPHQHTVLKDNTYTKPTFLLFYLIINWVSCFGFGSSIPSKQELESLSEYIVCLCLLCLHWQHLLCTDMYFVHF